MKGRYLLQTMLLALVLLPGVGWAQDAQSVERKGAGYAFVAPGAFRNGSLLGFGVGGERLLKAGFGISADVGYYTRGGFETGLGLFSPGVLYQFQRTTKVVPFVNGGYSLACCSVLNMVYFGGGVNYCPKNRLGLRFEFRDQLSPSDTRSNLLQFRIGLLFR